MTVALWLLAPILAAGGSGSSGFGGGGGGGGGGFSGGGGGSGGPAGTGSLAVFLVIVAVVAVVVVMGLVGSWRLRRRRAERVARVRLAAAEAAEDDAAFAPDRVGADAGALFTAVQRAWDARDRAALGELLGADLLAEWTRRLDDFDAKGWHNRVKLLGAPRVEYVGLVNRAADAEDRVVVRIEAALEDYVETASGRIVTKRGQTSRMTALREYWTLGKRDGGWRLLSIEQDAEGAHQLDAPIVASPWGDDERLRDQSLTELAVADAAPHGVRPGELADLDFDGSARAAALDLALADPRFDPAVLEAAVRRVVAAWVEAVDGADAPLEAVAAPAAVDALLYDRDATRRTRLVVRGARAERVTVERLEAAAEPPAMVVAVTVRGRRYVQDRDTAAILSGSDARDDVFTARWRLTLDGPPAAPWRLAGPADAPARPATA